MLAGTARTVSNDGGSSITDGEYRQRSDLPADRPAPEPTLREPGERIDGRWRLQRALATDASGALWVARDERLERDVVLGFVPPQRLLDDADRRYVVREASLLARVENQNVVCLFDVVGDEGGLIMVSEYVGGRSLQEISDQLAPCPETLVAAVGLQLARGLRAVHERDVIHHELQCSKVRVLASGTVKIMDFGSATSFTSAGRTTSSLAPPSYLAPEQIEAAPVDHRIDLYALGLILWELATGRRPFPERLDGAALDARLRSEPAPLSTLDVAVSPALSTIVERATRRWPEQRWQHAADLEAALNRLCGPRPEEVVRTHLEEAGLT